MWSHSLSNVIRHCSAYTSDNATVYYFDVGVDHLAPALDRFAQFFISPLLNESATERCAFCWVVGRLWTIIMTPMFACIASVCHHLHFPASLTFDRYSNTPSEVNAVDSEHSKNLDNDGWRLRHLDCSLSDPSHPFSLFSTGRVAYCSSCFGAFIPHGFSFFNLSWICSSPALIPSGSLETLWNGPRKACVNVREELLNFHRKYYSANLITVAVYGRSVAFHDSQKQCAGRSGQAPFSFYFSVSNCSESLDELQTMATQLFNAVPNYNVSRPTFDSSPFRDVDLAKMIKAVSIKVKDFVFSLIPQYFIFSAWKLTIYASLSASSSSSSFSSSSFSSYAGFSTHDYHFPSAGRVTGIQNSGTLPICTNGTIIQACTHFLCITIDPFFPPSILSLLSSAGPLCQPPDWP